jgi:hypothetical protein
MKRFEPFIEKAKIFFQKVKDYLEKSYFNPTDI